MLNDDSFHLKSQIRKLQDENEMLAEENEDLKDRYNNLKKQLEIWNQIQHNHNASQLSKEKERLVENENQYLKAQVVHAVNEKQYLERSCQELKDKVSDLKYHNKELKAYHEKLALLHTKQIEMINRETVPLHKVALIEEREKKITQEKDEIKHKLDHCANIAKEMETHFVNEMKKKNQEIRCKNSQISELLYEIQNLKKQMERQEDARHLEQVIKKQSNEKRMELKVTQVKEEYEQQIKHLQERITHLESKLEGLEDSTITISKDMRRSSGDTCMIQSKFLQSNCSHETSVNNLSQSQQNQHTKLTSPNHSISQQFKDNRRNTTIIKTPNKYSNVTCRNGKTYGPLFDKTNI